MKSVSSSKSGTDYVSLLKYELNEMGLIYQDPSLKSYQKDVEQKLLEEEFDIRFKTSNPEDIQKKLLKLDKKGFERRYQAGMLTAEEYKNGMELAREEDRSFVPEDDRKYGGKSAMKDFVEDENALTFLGINIGGKSATTEGEVGKTEKKGIVGGIIDWAGRHPYLSTAGLLGLFAGGIAANEYASNKKFASAVDDGLAKAKAEITAGASGISAFFGSLGGKPPVAIDNPAANASATPQVTETPAPSYDYYDKDFKVGIVIEGDSQFKHNVTNLLKTMKEVTPNLYNGVIPFAAKKIVRSTENYNYYWHGKPPTKYIPGSDDEIGLTTEVERLGGSEDIKKILRADAFLYAEEKGGKADKTGEMREFKNNYEVELFQASNVERYNVEAGIKTKESANIWLKSNVWFKVLRGRYPTPEELQGIDIEKHLVK